MVSPTRIVEAIGDLSPRPGGCVRLTMLRDLLADIDRDTLDASLIDLDRQRIVQLEPDPDRAVLTAADRACSIELGGQSMHLVRLR